MSSTVRHGEALFRALVEHSWDGVELIDRDGVILYASPAHARVLGEEPSVRAGHSGFARLHPDDLPRIRAEFAQLVERPGARITTEYRVRHADGSWLWMEGTVTNLLHDPDVGAVVVNFRDVTERRRLEEELRQAQKMEAVGRLAGGVAHDFNNYLTVIIGYTDFLAQRLEPGDPRLAYAEEVARAARQAAELTRQLLAFGRKQTLQPRVLDLNALVLDTEKLLCRLIGEDVTLVTVLHPELGAIRADPMQIQQVLLNLAVNARDAMTRGGKLTITTDEARPGGTPSLPQGLDPAAYVRLSVSDTGTGMGPEVLDHLFEPFFTTKEMGKGTGLGLSTVLGIVEQSGGRIEVASEVGSGTTFHLFLPRADPDTAAPALGPRVLPPPGSEAVLLVEDEPQVRAFARLALERAGYRVCEAATPAEALRIAGDPGERIDLLLSDVVMPEMNGRELAERAVGLRPGLRVLYFSGYTGDALREQGVLEGDLDLLQKPFTPEALAAKVRGVLDRV